ncbi:MAG: NAD(P)H-dependent glycerol-3-phosphate dehydrogenase [Kofleriaceae bacterium]|nr:NAD(P)H-dependent glycerol-3-phosphate dehydrogenase [Kofleriaceae bacterium]
MIAVLGAGNWGTTLAELIAENGNAVRLWTRSGEQRDEINARHTNERSLPGVWLSDKVLATTALEQAVHGAELVLLVVPASAFREVSSALGEVLAPEQIVLHATKGLERETNARMTEILRQETCAKQLGVISGPNLAPEVARRMPAGTVVASHFPHVIALAQKVLSCPRMMVFTSDDVLGIELAGALKNVVAIAAGAATEMKVGENAKALLVTRGLAEYTRLSVMMGASPLTFAGLAGIGDLMVTCASPISRNHRVGAALARGERLPEILAKLGMVAEGVHAVVAARALTRAHHVEAPLLDRVYRLLYEDLGCEEALRELMALPAGRDVGRFQS